MKWTACSLLCARNTPVTKTMKICGKDYLEHSLVDLMEKSLASKRVCALLRFLSHSPTVRKAAAVGRREPGDFFVCFSVRLGLLL